MSGNTDPHPRAAVRRLKCFVRVMSRAGLAGAINTAQPTAIRRTHLRYRHPGKATVKLFKEDVVIKSALFYDIRGVRKQDDPVPWNIL